MMWLTPLKPSAVRLLGRPLGVRDFLLRTSKQDVRRDETSLQSGACDASSSASDVGRVCGSSDWTPGHDT
ncbi:hypothetical protein HaLaN_23408 [Haematococcus lacustris]|uniref:Uncharacterized protein n=1 Tax=Haematococcus lacustris TaxID=44745 RepID=A0A6A0A234_HAELA|nr:hypothetical protein HaLaN_23408 [Haematococcus lacustris]